MKVWCSKPRIAHVAFGTTCVRTNSAPHDVQRIADHHYQPRWYYSDVIRCAAVTRYVVDMFAEGARAARSPAVGVALRGSSRSRRPHQPKLGRACGEARRRKLTCARA